MKVLLSVFECNPLKGSDSYVGWSYVINMAEKNEVYALTRTANRLDIENFCMVNKLEYLDNIHFIYVEQSKFFTEKIYMINKYFGFLGSYFVWQKDAYKAALKLCKEVKIDICHHISIADFRCAGYLWKIGKPFIFGPVGGGQETPECLHEYIKGHEKSEKFRSIMNKITTSTFGYRKALEHAKFVYSSNDETTKCIKRVVKSKDKIIQKTELCIDDNYLRNRENIVRNSSDVVHILVSGRLIYRKGIALLLDAVKLIDTNIPFVVDIYGEGDQKELLVKQSIQLDITNKVKFWGKIDFDKMQKVYKDADIYVLPSLRESTGTAVFEAMANKLPVVSLNQNGVKYIVQDDAGILVELGDLKQVQKDLANALKTLIEDEKLRTNMGQVGYNKIKEKYTWQKRIQEMDNIYRELVNNED